ncbi:uncharacterized protein [Littorina saxatilis]|uniref:Uncharacterized protein n=1 Tax=Littorina saxatilis TaxID=31220 RepID=A0AAN9B4I2_9CAEN
MQRARVSNHPCHRLSVPAAKRFWCRHCMMVFEDAITRWRHSRSCRSGGFDNFVRRREIETQALQKMAETLDPDMMTQMSAPSGEGTAGNSKDLCCFICKQRFVSLDEMREHVKYPCNKPVALPRPSMTVYIEEPTFGTGIQQHYTDGPAVSHSRGEQCSSTVPPVSSSAGNPHPVTVYMNESEHGHPDSEAKPTNIYVNEKGETVIEVENLDLNTKSGELSLAHLLTQLSQQGIVFDQQPQGETEITTSHQEAQVVQESAHEVDYSQPTAVDAANTLTQLAGSMYRATSNPQDAYTYAPPTKRIKAEAEELQYSQEQSQHLPVHAYIQKEELPEGTDEEKYIICTSESEVISVVRANNASPDDSNSEPMFRNGAADDESESETKHVHTTTAETVIFEGHPDQGSHSQTLIGASTDNGPAEGSFAGSQMVMLQAGQVQVEATPTGQLFKSEDPTGQLVIAPQGVIGVEETGQETVVSHFPGQESSVTVVDTDHAVISQEQSLLEGKSSLEAGSNMAVVAEDADLGLVDVGEEPVRVNVEEDSAADPPLLIPQIVSVTSEAPQVTLQHTQDPDYQGSAAEYNMIQTPASEGEASSKKY